MRELSLPWIVLGAGLGAAVSAAWSLVKAVRAQRETDAIAAEIRFRLALLEAWIAGREGKPLPPAISREPVEGAK